MSRYILDEIVRKRKADIDRLGLDFGCNIPVSRLRPLSPFIAEKGAVLEIKRASPSKGLIAPELDAGRTAEKYASAGASAISVLTENNYFKGSLADLQDVCAAIDVYSRRSGKTAPAVLRKDFLLFPEEIEVSYRAGADAVLLIARILDERTLVDMTEKCAAFGITPFIELRLDDDMRKLRLVLEKTGRADFVCGVNSRDLNDFSIDLLAPAVKLGEIRRIAGDNARVIFESGIRTTSAARFAGSLGFSGMLLGEAAAKNPDGAGSLVDAFMLAGKTANAGFWLRIAEKINGKKDEFCRNGNERRTAVSENTGLKTRPLVKICGITNKEDAVKSAELGSDMLGFVFYDKSPRSVSAYTAEEIADVLKARFSEKTPVLAAVVAETKSAEFRSAVELVARGVLDVLQLHGSSAALIKDGTDGELCSIPHYCAVNMNAEDSFKTLDLLLEKGEGRILVDAGTADCPGGSGKCLSDGTVLKCSSMTKLWLAGGINPENVRSILHNFPCELIDVSSGVESSPGKKDFVRLEKLFKEISEV